MWVECLSHVDKVKNYIIKYINTGERVVMTTVQIK